MTVFYTNVARRGNDLLIRIADDMGNRRLLKKKFEPTLYLPTADYSNVEKVGLLNEPLVAKQFPSMRDADNYLEEYKEVQGAAIYGQTDYAYQFIAHSFPGKIEPDYSNIHIANLDIEVFSAGWKDGKMTKGPFPHPTIEQQTFKGNEARIRRFHKQVLANHEFVREHFPGSFISNNVTDQFPIIDSNGKITQDMNAAFPITLIQLQDMATNKFMVWGMPCAKDRAKFRYDPEDAEIGGLEVEYKEFVTEQDLLRSFLDFWSQRQFDGWTGWNIETFDSPYLVERMNQVLGEAETSRLSPGVSLRSVSFAIRRAISRRISSWVALCSIICRSTRNTRTPPVNATLLTGLRIVSWVRRRWTTVRASRSLICTSTTTANTPDMVSKTLSWYGDLNRSCACSS